MTFDRRERNARLLRSEQTALEEAGITCEISVPDPEQDLWARHVDADEVLRVQYPVPGRTLELFVVLPDHYRYFPPVVIAPRECFARHQDPRTRQLCLVRDAWQWDDWQWDPSSDDVATLLAEQLPKLLAAQVPEPAGVEGEVKAPEPQSSYYHYLEGAYVIVDSSWDITGERGELTLGLAETRHVHPVHKLPLLRAAVLEIRDADGNQIATADQRLSARFAAAELTVRWARANVGHEALTPKDFADLLEGPEHGLRTVKRSGYRTTDGSAPPHPKYLDVCAVVTEEEVEHRKMGTGWAFLVRAARSHHPHAEAIPYLVRAVRAGPTDLAQRIPELTCLPGKTAVIVGLGGVGAFIALELARAGIGTLILVDPDAVEPANSVRWPLGFAAAGNSKVGALAGFIAQHHPYTAVEPIPRRLGQPNQPGLEPEAAMVEQLMERADVVIDATGDRLVHLLLGDRAKAWNVPFVVAHTTFGGWGGLTARVPADHDACIWCLQAHSVDEEQRSPGETAVASAVKLPPSDDAGEIVPTGCSATTFTGAGFDTARIAQPAVQLAVSTLCSCGDGYPSAEWDIGVLSLRDPTGRFLEPSWDTFSLAPHPRCCGRSAA